MVVYLIQFGSRNHARRFNRKLHNSQRAFRVGRTVVVKRDAASAAIPEVLFKAIRQSSKYRIVPRSQFAKTLTTEFMD